MHVTRFSIDLGAALIIASSLAVAAEPEFAIPNASRPGGKMPHCPAQGETPDGCIFHTLKDDINRVRLPSAPGVYWRASTPDAALLNIREGGQQPAADGTKYQLVEIIPTAPQDADISVTFDKLADTGGKLRITERRRVFLMKHSLKTWNE